MKRVLLSILVTVGSVISMSGVVAAAPPCNSVCKVNKICTGVTPGVSPAYKAKYCPIYGQGGLYCTLFGWNC